MGKPRNEASPEENFNPSYEVEAEEGEIRDQDMPYSEEDDSEVERNHNQPRYIQRYEITGNDSWAHALIATEEMVKHCSQSEAITNLQKMPDGLFRAMQIQIETSTLEKLVTLKSSSHLLLFEDKTQSREGENVLHAAVLSGNVKKVEILYNELAKEENKVLRWKLLDRLANSKHREDTVMQGELPLSVAALKLNRGIVDYLLRLGADVCKQNSRGDTVIHSLIRFAAKRPEKIADIRDMMQLIYTFIDKLNQDVETLFTLENKEKLSPLQLAVTKSVNELSIFLLSLRNVYRRDIGSDGIYDRKIYDITTLDSITNRIAKKEDNSFAPTSDSILDMIFANHTETETGLELVKHEIISYVIQEKWKSYKLLFLIWMFLHMSMVILLTAYSIVRIDFYFVDTNMTVNSVLNGHSDHDFVIVMYWILLLLAFFAIVLVILFVFSRTVAKQKWTHYLAHNIDYFVIYFIFVITIIVDTIYLARPTTEYNGEALIFSVLCGWLFSTFFLRAFAKCGYLTALVRRVIIRDILGFAFVFLFLLVAFSTCLHDLLKYKTDENGNKEVVSDYKSFGRTMFLLFHAMFGLSEVAGIFEARSSWLALFLLVLFLLITYALLVNALIGIITSTCEEIFQNKHSHMIVDKLSVLLFMEEMFALFCLKKPLGERVNSRKGVRFIIEIKSEALNLTDDKKVIAKEKEDKLRLRDTICDALLVSETIVFGYKCVDCKRREMVLTSNRNPKELNIIQKYTLDSEGRPIKKSLKA